MTFGLLVEPRGDRLQHVGQRAERHLQLLGLLLQHADVGDDLLMFTVRGGGRSGVNSRLVETTRAAQGPRQARRAAPRVKACVKVHMVANSLLRGHDEMSAAVLGPGRFVVIRIEGELLAVADGPHAIRDRPSETR